MKLENKYIGHDKIVKVVPAGKTYLGKERVKLEFEEGFLELPLEVAEFVATKEFEEDLSILQGKRINPVVSQIMVLLTEAELNRDDISALIQQQLPGVISEANKLAKEKLFGMKEHKITLLDIDKIISKK